MRLNQNESQAQTVEIIPNLLSIADTHILLELFPGAEIAIDILTNQDRLDRCEAKHYACSKKAMQDCQAHLDWRMSATNTRYR